jgi:hypothetical protein
MNQSPPPARPVRPDARRVSRGIVTELLRRPRALALTLAAGATAVLATPYVAQLSPAELPQATEQATQALAELPLQLASATAEATDKVAGRHLGFDTNIYPGDAAMQAWREAGRYEWVGYYLPAPCHKDGSWAGKRARLVEQGWGLAVIYVGQQTWGRTPRPHSPAARTAERGGAECSADFVHGARGARDAADAIARTAVEGFPRGTIIFLDVERMERVPQQMRDYYREWTARVLADGRFRPGVYVHAHNAQVLHDDLVREYAGAGVVEEPTLWVASGRNFSRDKFPADVGHHFAHVWQGMLDVVEKHNGVRLPIDVNVAAVPSPSERYAVAAD